MKGYLANGLFTCGDRAVNSGIALLLRDVIPGVDLYVPQENAAINDKNAYADSVTISKADTEELLASDFLIAVIDGVEIDAGVAAEVGIFSTTGKPIFALYSDVRQLGRDNSTKIDALVNDATENQFMYRNLFVVGLIKQSGGKILTTVPELVKTIKEKMA
ncbi:nucleoside 2-deoxyribosyltransferase [Bacillus sp. FSL R10-2789]|uniref:nucleoside 2-deoxyribosyltransferase n=1 Tax=Bacillus sp. FSL R10-2789 TaxID=2954662 RepID=UPI0030F9E3E3